MKGTVGCLVDPELISDKSAYTRGTVHYDPPLSTQFPPNSTPDTSFYQWVPFCLVLQAAIFYLPRKIWKICEGGLIASFGRDAKKTVIMKEDSEMEDGRSSLKEDIARKYSTYFLSLLHHNNGYFIQFVLCECLNLFVDILNIYLTDYLLGGRFVRYGTQAMKYLSYDQVTRLSMPNPMCTVFPTITSCTLYSVGTGAGEQRLNSLCVLSLNIINEKVYLVLWFWLFGLTILTSLHLVFRILLITVPPLRFSLLLLRSRCFSPSDLSTCKNVLAHCYLGDWFVLYQLSKNSNTYFFRYLLRHLEKSFVSKDRHKTPHPTKCGVHSKYRGDAGKRSNGATMEEQERKMTNLLATMEGEETE